MDILASLCLLAILSSVLGARYYISKRKTTWTDALTNNYCKLATPKLDYLSNQIVSDLLDVTIREDVWTGYYEVRTAFEYIGCKPIGTNEQDFATTADPGQCLSACLSKQKQPVIGISGNKCFCFSTNEIQIMQHTMKRFCIMECQDLHGIACGGTSHMSLYRSIGPELSSIGNQSDVTRCSDYNNNKFNWKPCLTSYAALCEKDNHAWIEIRDGGRVFRKWIESTIICFENGTRPSGLNSTKQVHVNQSTSQTWTGIVRSHVIYRYSSFSNLLGYANKVGYLKKDTTSLQWENSSTSKKKSLCINESYTTTTVTATEPATTQTEEPSVTDTIQHLKDKDQNESSDVGAIVGATLTILIVIAIAIVSVIYVRKRGFTLPSFLKKEKREPPTSNANNNNAYVISRPVEILQSSYKTDPDTYAEIDLATTSYNEGNKSGTTGKAHEGDDEEQASPYSHDYFVLEKVDEGEYDTTKDADQTKIPNPNPNTFNPYNKLDFEQSSNYDHIGASKGGNAKRHVSDSENTYNTTDTGYLKKSIGKTDNDYDTADGTEDDTYNHTNIQGHQKGLRTSENDYDAI